MKTCLTLFVCLFVAAAAAAQSRVTGTFLAPGGKTPAQADLVSFRSVNGTAVYGYVDFEPFDNGGRRAISLVCNGNTYFPQAVRAWIKGDGTLISDDGTAGIALTGTVGCQPAGASYRASIYIGASHLAPSARWTEVKAVPASDADWADLAFAPPSGVVYQGYRTIIAGGAVLPVETALAFAGAGITCVDDAALKQTDCTVSGGGGGTGGGGWTLRLNNALPSVTDPINFQDSPTVALSNPSSGNVQWTVVPGSIANSHLAGGIAESKIANLSTDLANRSLVGHTHVEADVTNLAADLAGKANAVHTHAESDVTGLVSDLASKASTSHTHAATDIVSGILPFARGGFGALPGAADSVFISTSPSAGSYFLIPDCSHGATDKLLYTTATHSFSCATDQLGAGGSGYNTVAQGGANLAQRATINFSGAGVSCVDNSSLARTDCTVTSGGAGLADPGGNGIVKRTAANVTAPAVAGTDYAAAAHTHAESDVANLTSDLAGKAAASHTHAESDVVNLTTDLAGKAAASHTHPASDIASGILAGNRGGNGADVSAFNGIVKFTGGVAGVATAGVDYAAAAHTHAESDVTNLVSDLASKAPATRTITTTAPLAGGGDLTGNLTLSCQTASASQAGCLSSTDYSTFNAKVPSTRTVTGDSTLTGGGDLSANRTLSVVADSVVEKVDVAKAGVTVGTRRKINFVDGSNATVTLADDSANNRVNVTVAASSTSGAALDLSNLSPTNINLTLTPATAAALDLGSSAKQWRDIYISGNIYGSGTPSMAGTPGSCSATAAGEGNLCFDATNNRPRYSYSGGSFIDLLLASDLTASVAERCGASPAATPAVNTACLQSALNAGGEFTLLTPGRIWISSTLVLPQGGNIRMRFGPNTELAACSNWVAGSCVGGGEAFPLLRNYVAANYTSTTGVTLSWTSGMTMTVNWSAHGLACLTGTYPCTPAKPTWVRIAGADQPQYDHIFQVYQLASANAFQVMLLRMPAAAPTGTIVAQIVDQNIEITGGIFNPMYPLNTMPANPLNTFGLALGGIEHLTLRDFKVNNAPKFAVSVQGVRDLESENFCSDYTNSDGFHINGPFYNVRVTHSCGHGGDDWVILDPGIDPAYATFLWSGGGDGINAVIDGTAAENNGAGCVALYPDQKYWLDQIVIRNTSCVASGSSFVASIAAGSGYTGAVNAGSITYENTTGVSGTNQLFNIAGYSSTVPVNIQQLRIVSPTVDPNSVATYAPLLFANQYTHIDHTTFINPVIAPATWPGGGISAITMQGTYGTIDLVGPIFKPGIYNYGQLISVASADRVNISKARMDNCGNITGAFFAATASLTDSVINCSTGFVVQAAINLSFARNTFNGTTIISAAASVPITYADEGGNVLTGATWLALNGYSPTVSSSSLVKPKDCSLVGHVVGIDSTGLPLCSADSGGGGGAWYSWSAPTFGVAAGTYNNDQSDTLTCPSGATAYYTTDAGTTVNAYSTALTMNTDNTTLAARCEGAGRQASSPASALYNFQAATPTASPVAGTYSSTQSVTLSDATTSSGIVYCTDTVNTCTPGTSYSTAISVPATGYVRAQGTRSGYQSSSVMSAQYVISGGGITFVQKCTGSLTTAGTSLSTSGCAAFGAGNTLIVWACGMYGDLPSTFSDGGDTFALITPAAGAYCRLGYVVGTTGGGTSVTATLTSSSRGMIQVLEYSGIAAVDKSAINTTLTSPITFGPTATTTAANELLVAAIFSSAGTGVINPTATTSPFTSGTVQYNTICCSNTIALAMVTVAVSSTGAYSYTGTTSVSTAAEVLVTFK